MIGPTDVAGSERRIIELFGITSVAVLLDEARDLLVAARDGGERPEMFVVDAEMLAQLHAMRRTQVALTGAVAVFGLVVVAPDA